MFLSFLFGCYTLFVYYLSCLTELPLRSFPPAGCGFNVRVALFLSTLQRYNNQFRVCILLQVTKGLRGLLVVKTIGMVMFILVIFYGFIKSNNRITEKNAIFAVAK
jgi:hypothetical protein